MSIYDYVKVFRAKWRILLSSVVIATMAAIGYFYVQPSEYTATVQLYVSAPALQSPDLYLSSSQLVQGRVESYSEMAKSPRVLNSVIRELQLAETADELSAKVSAAATNKSVIITLSVVDGDALRAARITDAMATALGATVADLERPTPPSTRPSVAVQALQPTPVPTGQSNLGLQRLLALGILAGLVGGTCLVLLRHALDNTFESSPELAAALEAPDLGEVAHENHVGRANSLNEIDQRGAFIENIKKIRANIQFLDVNNPHKVFVITSALPGEGKTTTATTLCQALASSGHKVLLVDADLRRPKVATVLQLDGGVGLTSVLTRRHSIREALQRSPGADFDVLASGPIPPNPSELLSSGQARELVERLRNSYDVVLIDTSPLIPVGDALGIAAASGGALMVCRARQTTRAQVKLASTALHNIGVPLLGTILTMVPRSSSRFKSYGEYGSTAVLGEAGDSRAPDNVRVHREELTDVVNVGALATQPRRPSPYPLKDRSAANGSVYGGRP